MIPLTPSTMGRARDCSLSPAAALHPRIGLPSSSKRGLTAFANRPFTLPAPPGARRHKGLNDAAYALRDTFEDLAYAEAVLRSRVSFAHAGSLLVVASALAAATSTSEAATAARCSSVGRVTTETTCCRWPRKLNVRHCNIAVEPVTRRLVGDAAKDVASSLGSGGEPR